MVPYRALFMPPFHEGGAVFNLSLQFWLWLICDVSVVLFCNYLVCIYKYVVELSKEIEKKT